MQVRRKIFPATILNNEAPHLLTPLRGCKMKKGPLSMSEKKKTVKFDTKLYRLALRRAEKDSFRQLLASQESDVPDEDVSSDEIQNYKERARITAARLVEKGVADASENRAHPHNR